MNKWKIFKHELVEVVIPANSTAFKYNFPDVQNLRNKHLLSMDVYPGSLLPRSIISQNNVVTSDVLKQGFLTLQLMNGKNFLNQMPLNSFISLEVSENADDVFNRTPRDFVGQRINWPKCYIEFTQDLTESEVDRSVLFSVWYRDELIVEERDLAAEFGNRS